MDGVRLLHSIALQIRRRRFDGGALRIESPKLKFRFYNDSSLPCGVCLDEVGNFYLCLTLQNDF